MGRVTVYLFEKYNVTTGEMVRSKRPATREAIASFRGKAIEDSGFQVDKSRLDSDGLLVASRANLMRTPEHRVLVGAVEKTDKTEQQIDSYERALLAGYNLYCPRCWPDPQPLAQLTSPLGDRLGCPKEECRALFEIQTQ